MFTAFCLNGIFTGISAGLTARCIKSRFYRFNCSDMALRAAGTWLFAMQ